MRELANNESRGKNQDETLDQTSPQQINSPDYKGKNLPDDATKPFVNQFGVVIGDNFYDSPNSPLNNWSEDVDPAIMSGEQWVHPTNDIGWNARENKELLEQGVPPGKARFMHPTKDVSYRKD